VSFIDVRNAEVVEWLALPLPELRSLHLNHHVLLRPCTQEIALPEGERGCCLAAAATRRRS
jgi:hypothetical protein